jgi:uncharacterized protein (DUF488 family)
MMSKLHTIGHSTRSLEEFLDALHAHSIDALVDIRSIPMSRRLPHFNGETLEASLAQHKIRYMWMKELGGRRKRTRNDSPNIALRNESFRNYADHMLTEEFHSAAKDLVTLANRSSTAYMCAERVYFRCHRMLVSDYLVTHGHEVFHIDGRGPAKAHTLMKEARVVDGELIYRGDMLL